MLELHDYLLIVIVFTFDVGVITVPFSIGVTIRVTICVTIGVTISVSICVTVGMAISVSIRAIPISIRIVIDDIFDSELVIDHRFIERSCVVAEWMAVVKETGFRKALVCCGVTSK